jgi:hypothetical protein
VIHDVSVSLSDADTSKPIHARVHVRDASGDYWPPQGHAKKIAEGWREDVGGDVIVDGRAYAYGWVHMASRGWYSGDTHTHFLSPARPGWKPRERT